MQALVARYEFFHSVCAFLCVRLFIATRIHLLGKIRSHGFTADKHVPLNMLILFICYSFLLIFLSYLDLRPIKLLLENTTWQTLSLWLCVKHTLMMKKEKENGMKAFC